MTYLVVGLAALAASALTLFSGFGLGTLLLPVFALFFPVRVAVAATAVVHALNNLFKLTLLRREVDRALVLRFGLPAALAAFPGAWLLGALPSRSWHTWHWGARSFDVTPVGVVMGTLILVFAAFEAVPALQRWRAPAGSLPWGGALSGFFGGLSGHQGALRAAFLTPLGLSPARFAATQSAIACMVDGARLLVYGAAFFGAHARVVASHSQWPLGAAATIAAFAGAWLGTRLLPKITLGFVRGVTAALLLVVGVGLATGLV
jgi:uncharacterized membrane protein YfcA